MFTSNLLTFVTFEYKRAMIVIATYPSGHWEVLELIPALILQKAGTTLERLPVYQRADPRRYRGKTCKLHTERSPEPKSWLFLL